jgi:HEAT repeat protein
MDPQRAIAHICDESAPLSATRLYLLSHLSEDGLTLLAQSWSAIDAARRRRILTALIEIAEANVTVDFGGIFRLGLSDEDAEVRALAVDGLWEDRSPALADTLLELLSSDPSILVRSAAATGLGRFVLLAELEEVEERLGTRIVEALWKVIQDPSEALEPRRRATEAISYSGREGVHELIDQAHRHASEKMRISAVFSMGRSADPVWGPTVIGELGSSSPEMRFEAVRACGELELRESVTNVIRLIADSDREVQQAAISALGKIGGQEARRALILCCESEDEVIAAAGDEALSELELTAGIFDPLSDEEDE